MIENEWIMMKRKIKWKSEERAIENQRRKRMKSDKGKMKEGRKRKTREREEGIEKRCSNQIKIFNKSKKL